MKPNNIGYIILENDGIKPDSVTVLPQSKNGRIYCKAIFQSDLDSINRNGRIYSVESIADQLVAPRTVELLKAKALRCEQGHPLDKSLERQTVILESNCSCIILDLHMEGNDVCGTFTNTSNTLGKALAEEVLEIGYRPAFSLRALGSLQQTKRGSEVHGVKIITYDEIIFPSHKRAYTSQVLVNNEYKTIGESAVIEENSNSDIVTENTAEIIPITNESVINYLQSQSSNIKFIRECFDFAYNSVNVNENGSTVTLTTKEGDILVINLERYIHNELMDYATKNKF